MSSHESRPPNATVFRPRRVDAQAPARSVTLSRFQAGGFGIGLVIGLLVALAAALVAALIITRTPAPFVDKVPSSGASDRLPMMDPNAALGSSRNATKVVTPEAPPAVDPAPAANAPVATGMDDAQEPVVPPPTVPNTATLPAAPAVPMPPAKPVVQAKPHDATVTKSASVPDTKVAALMPPPAVTPPQVDPIEAARKAKEAADRRAKILADRKAAAKAKAEAQALEGGSDKDPDAILNGRSASTKPADPARAASTQRTFVQAGAFSSREQADRQRAQLTLQGYVVQVQERQVNGNTIFRVRLGPFSRRAQAEVAQAELQAMSVPSILVPAN